MFRDSLDASQTKRVGNYARISVLLWISIFGVSHVLAQSVDDSAEDSRSGALEEVTVTAQRREQSLQEVPISVTAFDAENLREINARVLSDIATRTPGFAMGTFNLGQPQLYIRGIGSNADGAGSDSSVVTFVDEVYVGRATAANLEIYDLERFEVLRGPQGTLFGKNVIGGALNLTTTRPADSFTGRFEVTAGDLGLLEARGFVSGPLADSIKGKVAVTARERDGYIKSADPTNFGAEYGDLKNAGVRAGLLIEAGDDVDVYLTADFSADRYGPAGHYVVGGLIGSAQAAYDSRYAANPDYTFADFVGYQDRDVWGFMGRVDWHSTAGTFTSISALRGADYEMEEDHVGTGYATYPLIQAGVYIDEGVDQFTQEFRFNSLAFNDRLNWTVGLYYLNEEVNRREDAQISFGASSPPVRPFPADSTRQFNETDSWSVFADATWSITDRWELTLGGRYTDESKDINQVAIEGCAACGVSGPYDVTASDSWDRFTPRAVLGFHLTDAIYTYASYTEGFKSGGFEGYASSATAASTPFNEELAEAYEGGFKSEWLQDRLRVNVAVYQTDYTDLQVLEIVQTPENPIGIAVTKNAGAATIQGAELEFQSQWGAFGLSGNYSYMDSETKEFGGPDDPRNGKSLRNSPQNSYYLAASYDWALPNGGNLQLRYDFRHQDKVFQDPLNLELASIPAYDVQDVRLAYAAPNGAWEVAGWVENLADERYDYHAWPSAPFAYVHTAAPPRIYGVTFSMFFGSN
jgi:iron complex outermembrane receptor protein